MLKNLCTDMIFVREKMSSLVHWNISYYVATPIDSKQITIIITMIFHMRGISKTGRNWSWHFGWTLLGLSWHWQIFSGAENRLEWTVRVV